MIDDTSASRSDLVDAALERLNTEECAELEKRITSVVMAYGMNRLPDDYPKAVQVFITSEVLTNLSHILSRDHDKRSAFREQQVLACCLVAGIQIGMDAAKLEKGTEA